MDNFNGPSGLLAAVRIALQCNSVIINSLILADISGLYSVQFVGFITSAFIVKVNMYRPDMHNLQLVGCMWSRAARIVAVLMIQVFVKRSLPAMNATLVIRHLCTTLELSCLAVTVQILELHSPTPVFFYLCPPNRPPTPTPLGTSIPDSLTLPSCFLRSSMLPFIFDMLGTLDLDSSQINSRHCRLHQSNVIWVLAGLVIVFVIVFQPITVSEHVNIVYCPPSTHYRS